jgi:hypothetical protein
MTTAELYQASTALAIPLLRTLAVPPLFNRIDALQVCADSEPYPQESLELIICCEITFQTELFAAHDNAALTFLAELLHERLARSIRGIAVPDAADGSSLSSYPRLRQIVDLASEGCGDTAVRLARRRAEHVYLLVLAGCPRPLLASVGFTGPGPVTPTPVEAMKVTTKTTKTGS